MKLDRKKLVATVALAGALTVGTAGVAAAADNPGTTKPGPAATGQARRHPRLRRLLRHQALKVTADTLHVSVQDVKDALKGGMSISQYVTSINQHPEDVVNALVKAADDDIDQAAKNHPKIAARATELKSKVPDRVEKLVNHVFGQNAGPHAKGAGGNPTPNQTPTPTSGV